MLTVRDPAATRRFRCDRLGMRWTEFDAGRPALAFGRQKINLRPAGHEIEPEAALPTPGSGDPCLLTDEPLDAVAARLAALGFPVLPGPVPRTGAVAPLVSVSFRDPDGDLVEVGREAGEGSAAQSNIILDKEQKPL